MFRFTIRELVLLTPMVAMGVAWFIDRSWFAGQLAESQASADTAWNDWWQVRRRSKSHWIELSTLLSNQ